MQKRFFIAPAAIVAFILFFTVFGDRGLLMISRLHRDRDEMQQKLADLKGENDKLKREIAALQSDRRYLESIARRDFGLVRSNETIYQFPSQDKPQPKQQSQQQSAQPAAQGQGQGKPAQAAVSPLQQPAKPVQAANSGHQAAAKTQVAAKGAAQAQQKKAVKRKAQQPPQQKGGEKPAAPVKN